VPVALLGLVGARYHHLDAYVERSGELLALRLGIIKAQLLHVCHCLLDEVRRRGALSRPMLQYHPSNPSCPDEFKDAADWERRIKQTSGYACDDRGGPVLFLDRAEIPEGIRNNNPWRRAGAGGRGPSLERKLRHLLRRMGGIDPSEDDMLAVLEFLCGGARFLLPQRLHGIRQGRMMLQVNADNVLLQLLAPGDRFRCSVCNERIPWCDDGAPCPACHGVMQPWPTDDIDANRYVQRIRKTGFLDLVCGEHTAQITGDARISLEENFKGGPDISPINVLACSPTLEMGIDVGGLDAVVMRNVPPRPDNYAQRGGRAGRRSRVGVVLGYARSTPHDGYFFDKPFEMIAGEMPVPPISLGNRDVVRRHLNAIVFGLADPPLAGRMAEYLTLQGGLKEAEIEAFITGLSARLHAAASIAWHSWEPELLADAGFQSEQDLVGELNGLPARVRDLFDRVRLQLLRLQETIQRWTDLGIGDRGAVHAMALKRKLLGIPDDNRIARGDADDRGSGHPMRRFAEFGILPGYEFPNEPCTLRLFGDWDEDQPIAVERRFGISQYQPDARVHARSHRWRVVGLDPASPWNPKSPEPSWVYVRCRDCDLRYGAQDHARCPRCGSLETTGQELPGHEFGGYVAVRDDTPVLEEEDRFSLASQVTCHPQWDGHVMGRFQLPNAWQLELRRGEQVRWINEGPAPSDNERQNQHLLLTDDSRGFYLCPSCGRNLRVPAPDDAQRRGRRRAARQDADPFQHANGCDRLGQPPRPLAIVTGSEATTLRIMVTLPPEFDEEEYLRWGHPRRCSSRRAHAPLHDRRF
jgi:helicase-like protein